MSRAVLAPGIAHPLCRGAPMSWSGWIATWRLHAQGRPFKAAMDRAFAAIAQAETYAGARFFCGLSGGKDSVALAGLLAEYGWTVPLVYVHTPLNIPCQREAAFATQRRLGFPLTVYEPKEDVWEYLRHLPERPYLTEPKGYEEFCQRFASGDLLASYARETVHGGAFSGMRAEESRGRRMNALVRGALYKSARHDFWICQPLVSWKARDVYAYLVSRDLSICDHYQRLYETLKVSPEGGGSRVDCIVAPENVRALGAHETARLLYPELWRKLMSVRPEFGQRGLL